MTNVDLVERVNPRTGETVLINPMFAEGLHWLSPHALTPDDVTALCGGDVAGVVRDLLRTLISSQHTAPQHIRAA